MEKIAALLAVASIAVAGNAFATVNLVQNGSFETAPGLTNGHWLVYGGSSLPGWHTNMGAGIEVQWNAVGAAYGGHNLVELDSYNNSNMWQDLVTVAGNTYELGFAYSARPNVAINSNKISFDVADTHGTISGSGIGQAGTNWHYLTFEFTADSALTRLSFAAAGKSDSLGGFIDNVSVTDITAPVPEPETYAMLGLGLLAVGFARRRKSL